MTAVVFAGPTIGKEEAQALLPGAIVLPPAGQGDIYKAARQGAAAIGLIDGFFEGVPSVWHKEILWAMERGIAVFGGASMGALRAVELSAFGMIGVGRIYEDYASGAIIDDDEVAVLHSPAELGYTPLSEPMVSIRATVEHAVSGSVLDAVQAEAVLQVAKTRFYKQRTWKRILADLPKSYWRDRFAAWVKTDAVDAKRNDAQEMLARMSEFSGKEEAVAVQVCEPMEQTLAWQGLVRRAEQQECSLQDADHRVLDELRLEPERYAAFLNRAALRFLALQEAQRSAIQPRREALLAQLNSHRQAHGLFRSKDLQTWLQANGLTAAQYEAELGEAARAAAAASAVQGGLAPGLLSELRLAGAYAGLKARADAKERQVSDFVQPCISMQQTERLQAVAWYFESRLHQDIPEDLKAYAAGIGIEIAEFYELIRREFMYHHEGKIEPASGSSDEAGQGQ
ncbi:TfuA-like protein [Leisingera sp. ANG-M7]|uniref:TfuA-like protein n=1 Tax=Leisingera sp. ANG-M7 TaxID=1577902 RepID=UPI00057DC31A|nr:TfuA-like protein [Leisingera sp. ANG-M7]KIC38385.1 TfuA domain protein, core [Leisingera sp. ANG-M7]